MICFLDLDGVLVDFMKGVHEFYDLPYSYKEYPYELGEWGICPPSSWALTPEEFWNGLDVEFWANLPWMEDGQEILKLVESVFGKENICLLTIPTGPCSAPGKIRWVEQQLPMYSKQFLIGPSKIFCANDKAVLIDDKDEHVEEFIRFGGCGFLVPRPWNNLYRIRWRAYNFIKVELEAFKESSRWKV